METLSEAKFWLRQIRLVREGRADEVTLRGLKGFTEQSEKKDRRKGWKAINGWDVRRARGG